MSTSETIAAMLTPHGRGAVAVIAVHGHLAEACVQRYFRPANGKPVASQVWGRIVYGRWGDDPGEGVLLSRRESGRLEIHCHGGIAAPTAILGDLQRAGCRLVGPWEVPPADRGINDLQRDAMRALASATTERTAAILLDQYRGALATAFAEIETALAAGNRLPLVRARIDRLLSLADAGRHLTQPWQVVIAGQPNVGKSSLINALAGYERAIVFDTPGTTRDVLSIQTAIDGWPVELTDTAGIRHTTDSLEQQAITHARQRLSAAELVLLVFDRSRPWSSEDQRLLDCHPQAILVHNKQDLTATSADNRPAGLLVSALTRAGIRELISEIGHRLVPHPPLAGEAVPFTEAQIQRLYALRDQMGASR